MIVDVAGDRFLKGMLFGFFISAFLLVFAKILSKMEVGEALQNIMGFFIAAPMFLFVGLRNATDFVMIIAYVFYWMILGGLFFWLSSIKKPIAQICLIFLVICILFLHYYTKVQIEESLSRAMSAFAQIFTGEATLGGN